MQKRFKAVPQAAGSIALLIALVAPACRAAPPVCTRHLVVASSQVGRAMIIHPDNSVHGAVRDFLDLVSQRTGCSFLYPPVPRARAWMMVETGQAHIMPAAAQSPERDRIAEFVPTHQVRPMLISLDRSLPPIATSGDLLRTRLHVGVVRSYSFGPAYHAMVEELERQDRLHVVADPQAIAKLLQAGHIQAAVLPPAAFADAGETSQLAKRLQLRQLADLPRVRIGFYLSRKALLEAERTALAEAMGQAVAGDAYGHAMRRHYPSWAMRDVITH